MKNRIPVIFSAIVLCCLVLCTGCSTVQVPGPGQAPVSPATTGGENPAPVNPQTPEHAIRVFLGDPLATVTFEKNFTDRRGIERGVYRSSDQRFTVDAMTGSITGISVISPDPGTYGPLSKDQTEAIALDYATRHYPDFSLRNMQLAESRLIDHGDAGAEYSFLWSEQQYGIDLGNYAGMSVDPDGKIRSYHEINKPVPSVMPAKISKMAANATAVDYVISQKTIGNITAIESGSRLMVLDRDKGTVAWNVNLEVRFMAPFGLEDHRGGNVYVDAMNGNIIRYEPCM